MLKSSNWTIGGFKHRGFSKNVKTWCEPCTLCDDLLTLVPIKRVTVAQQARNNDTTDWNIYRTIIAQHNRDRATLISLYNCCRDRKNYISTTVSCTTIVHLFLLICNESWPTTIVHWLNNVRIKIDISSVQKAVIYFYCDLNRI